MTREKIFLGNHLGEGWLHSRLEVIEDDRRLLVRLVMLTTDDTARGVEASTAC